MDSTSLARFAFTLLLPLAACATASPRSSATLDVEAEVGAAAVLPELQLEDPVARPLATDGRVFREVEVQALAHSRLSQPANVFVPEKPEYARWTVRGWAGVVTRTLESDNVTYLDPIYGTSELSWNDPSFGFGFDVEYRFSHLIGLDLAAGYTNMDINFDHAVGASPQSDSLGTLPIWLALNFHLLKSEKWDLYLGPQIAYVFYLNDLSFEVPGMGTKNVETTNEFPSLGLLIGADYWLSPDWGMNFGFRFQDADADPDHVLPLDPTFITLGVSRRF